MRPLQIDVEHHHTVLANLDGSLLRLVSVEVDPHPVLARRDIDTEDAIRTGTFVPIAGFDIHASRERTAIEAPHQAPDLTRVWRGSQGNILVLVLRKGSTAYVVVKRSS